MCAMGSKTGMKLSQLRALIAVAERGNFGEAALELELSQSAVSHAIAALEDELGVSLFSRGRHGANLTPVGERIVDQAQQVLQLIEGIEREANLAKGLQGGQVRVASFRSAATHILPAAIAHFHAKFPDIAVAIIEHSDFTGVEQALRDGRADIGFTYLPSSDEFETWEVLRDEYVVLLPPSPPLSSNLLTWEQLASYPLIVPCASDVCGIKIRSHFTASKIPLKPAYEVVEDSTIVSMVVQGLGAAILPRLAAEPIPQGVQVRSLPIPLERILGAAVLADALQVPAVFAFLDILKNTALPTFKLAVQLS